VVTVKEFTMSIGLDLRWMSVKEASTLLKHLESEKCVKVDDGFVRPAKDLSALQVPIAYRPPESLRKAIFGDSAASAGRPAKKAGSKDLFSVLVDLAVKNDIPKGKFVDECNRVRQKLGIEMCSAASLVLRDAGTDVSDLLQNVYEHASKV